jgi:transposase
VAAKAEAIAAALGTEQLRQPDAVTAAYAAAVRAQMAVLATLNTQIKAIQEQVEAHVGQHPDAEIYLSQPGLGVALSGLPPGSRTPWLCGCGRW